MPYKRRTIAVAASMAMAMGSAVSAAQADDTNIVYVNDLASADCVDSGTGAGTQATPFCTIQEGSDAAVPGDTVEIAPGSYGPVDVKAVGTASAPIVFESTGGRVSIVQASGQTGPVLSFDGAAYVSFAGQWLDTGLVSTIDVESGEVPVNSSSHITLDGIWLRGVQIAGTSSGVTVSRSMVTGDDISVATGSSGDVITTNYLTDSGPGITVAGASNTAITSNTETNSTATDGDVTVTGSTGTTIENNILAYPELHSADDAALVTVDAASAPTTTDDYNVVWPMNGSEVEDAAYSWAGIRYIDPDALNATTGQGKHDLIGDPRLLNAPFYSSTLAPQVNAANSAAPGMLSTDMFGDPCGANPIVAIRGAGSTDYCAIGAVQGTYTASLTPGVQAADALTADLDPGLKVGVTEHGNNFTVAEDTTPDVGYSVNWGDQHTSSFASGVPTDYAYAAAGSYQITTTAVLSTGATVSAAAPTSFTTAGSDYTPVTPTRILDTRSGLGAAKAPVTTGSFVAVKVAGVGSIPADATAVAVNLTATGGTVNGYLSANGGTSVSNVNYGTGQTVADNAIVPINPDGTIDIYNEGHAGGHADVIADVAGYFTRTAGSQYGPVALKRILDTRSGTGAPKAQVAGGTGVSVTVAGVDGIPANVTAVAVHITAVDAAGNGWIAAQADKGGTPTTSVINYFQNLTVSNTVIVPVGADGKIELYNGGTKTPVDLVADVSGYFSTTAPDAYVPVTPMRAWDTRDHAGWTLGPDDTQLASLEGGDGGLQTSPFPANAVMVSNITVTDTAANGYLTVYPFDTPRPFVSDLNYLRSQTVANLAIQNTTGVGQSIDVYNVSPGNADVIFDVFGYFSNS